MAEKDKAFNVCARRDLCEGTRPFDVGGQQVAAPSLRRCAGEMIDLIHTAQGCTYAWLIIETDDGYFHWNATR
jgi:hypothetical protein